MSTNRHAERAQTAQQLVTDRFFTRWMGIPGTLMGKSLVLAETDQPKVRAGWRQRLRQRLGQHLRPTAFNYWWQAHAIDAMVMACERQRTSSLSGARALARLAHRLLATIWLRNGCTLRNSYFDDMAWLALAVERLERCDRRLGLGFLAKIVRHSHQKLGRYLSAGLAPDGGMFWRTDRNFINAPATCPVALYRATTGDEIQARALMGWVSATLTDDDTGLVWDGWRLDGTVEKNLYTYNQATAMAAWLGLGGEDGLSRVDRIVASLSSMTVPCSDVLITHGSGDGGLFTGIMARYLAMVAGDQRVCAATKARATALVIALSDYMWDHRDPVTQFFPAGSDRVCDDGSGSSSATEALADDGRTAGCNLGHGGGDDTAYAYGGESYELSSQLQAWLIFEAASLVTASMKP